MQLNYIFDTVFIFNNIWELMVKVCSEPDAMEQRRSEKWAICRRFEQHNPVICDLNQV